MKHESGCPPAEDLSALIDGELAPGREAALRQHVIACPSCGAALQELGQLHADLQQLRQRTLATDLATIVLAQIGGAQAAAAGRKRRRGLPLARLWGLGPKVMGGALAFGVGAWLGMALLAGTGTAIRPAGMSAFDAERATAFCAGLPSCGPRGR